MVTDNPADTKIVENTNPVTIITIGSILDNSHTRYKSPCPTVKNVITTKYNASLHDINSQL